MGFWKSLTGGGTSTEKSAAKQKDDAAIDAYLKFIKSQPVDEAMAHAAAVQAAQQQQEALSLGATAGAMVMKPSRTPSPIRDEAQVREPPSENNSMARPPASATNALIARALGGPYAAAGTPQYAPLAQKSQTSLFRSASQSSFVTGAASPLPQTPSDVSAPATMQRQNSIPLRMEQHATSQQMLAPSHLSHAIDSDVAVAEPQHVPAPQLPIKPKPQGLSQASSRSHLPAIPPQSEQERVPPKIVPRSSSQSSLRALEGATTPAASETAPAVAVMPPRRPPPPRPTAV